MKNIIFITTFLFSIFSFGQRRTAYILIKEIRGESFTCPDQDVAYSVHTLSPNLSSKNKKKVLEVFAKRLKGNDKNAHIRIKEARLMPDEFIVFYQFNYLLNEIPYLDCHKEISTRLKGIVTSKSVDVEKLIQNQIKSSLISDKYLNHKKIAVVKPFNNSNFDLIDYLSNELKKLIRKNDSLHIPKKIERSTNATGVRG